MAATRTARLFRPVKNNRTGRLEKAISPDAIYKMCAATRPTSASR